MKTIRTAFASALLAVCAFSASAAEPTIYIPADYALTGVPDGCTATAEGGLTYLTVVATEQDARRKATIIVAPSLRIFLDDRQESMRLLETHCSAMLATHLGAVKAAEKQKFGFETKFGGPDVGR